MRFFAPSALLACCFLAAQQALPVAALDVNCFQGRALDANTIQSLIDDVDNNNLNPPESDPNFVPLGRESAHSFIQNGVKLCVFNGFLFDNTHIKLHDLAFAARRIVTLCGPGLGGSSEFFGDSGLVVQAQIRPSDQKCPGE